MNAIDTKVLLYAVDWNEPAKQLKAPELLKQLRAADEPTILLWQVLKHFGTCSPWPFRRPRRLIPP